jgi:thioredoxin 1
MDQREQFDVTVQKPRGVALLLRFSNSNAMRLFLFATAAVAMSCTSPQLAGDNLNAEAFASRLSEPGAQLLDVRTAGEFNGGHLANARNLDWTNGQLEAGLPELDKSKPVLLYCASGRRSDAARQFLKEQGFTDVVDLEGGIKAWTGAGLPVEP